jgi:radical SAM protein with 4Fe4S-binding SPASM domain
MTGQNHFTLPEIVKIFNEYLESITHFFAFAQLQRSKVGLGRKINFYWNNNNFPYFSFLNQLFISGVVKYRNALLAGYSYLAGTISGKPVIRGMPPAVSMELTNHCNLRCPECPSGSGSLTRERGFMEIDLFRRAVNELEPYLCYLNLWFQGEPMLHPDFFSFLEVRCKCRKVVSTNGHFLTEDNAVKLVMSDLSKLIISLDGMDQKSYEAYRRGGEIERVLKGIRNVSEARRKKNSLLKIVIQFLVNRKNEHQIPDVRKFTGEVQASLKLKSMQVINNAGMAEWMPDDKKFRRYEKVNGIWKINNPLPRRCARLWFNPVITWDGKVVPCCFDKNADHVLGDLKTQSFMEIWNGHKYNEFRQKLLSSRVAIEICRNCTSGLKKEIQC